MAACGKPLSTPIPRRVTTVDGRTVFGTIPEGPADRAVLRALPTTATYRWGLPSAHFTGVTPEEDSLSQTFAAHELRAFSSEVLRINGWQEAATGTTPEFELAVLRVERTAEWLESRPDPRGQMPDRNSCRNRPTAQRTNCVEPMPRDYPPITVKMRGTDVRFAFAIVRLADRATVWWISPVQSEIQIATLRLLQAGELAPPALSRRGA
ncbi:MAG TPA: hypothetical protein PK788_04710 [Gemmatimonadaceae bacterium]|nr:hypothetical protein [Gemmatimonadaceae bacterium]